jgi:hypothetical protein
LGRWTIARYIIPLVPGSGFAGCAAIISEDGWFLTAGHVLEAATKALVMKEPGKFVVAAISERRFHPVADVAMGKLEAPWALSPLKVEREHRIIGDDICSVGYAGIEPGEETDIELDVRYAKGYVARARNFDLGRGRHVVYELSFEVVRGLSGSPLLLPDTPILVGVLFGSGRTEWVEDVAVYRSREGQVIEKDEQRRVAVFGLACTIDSIMELEGFEQTAIFVGARTPGPTSAGGS